MNVRNRPLLRSAWLTSSAVGRAQSRGCSPFSNTSCDPIRRAGTNIRTKEIAMTASLARRNRGPVAAVESLETRRLLTGWTTSDDDFHEPGGTAGAMDVAVDASGANAYAVGGTHDADGTRYAIIR